MNGFQRRGLRREIDRAIGLAQHATTLRARGEDDGGDTLSDLLTRLEALRRLLPSEET